MLSWKNFAVVDRLDGSMVVILVDFLVESGLDSVLLLSAGYKYTSRHAKGEAVLPSDSLLRYGWRDILVDGGVVVSTSNQS